MNLLEQWSLTGGKESSFAMSVFLIFKASSIWNIKKIIIIWSVYLFLCLLSLMTQNSSSFVLVHTIHTETQNDALKCFTCSNSNAKPMAFSLSHTSASVSGTIFPIRHSATLFLQKQTKDISLLRIFQLSNTVLHPYQSVHCVCVRASFT